MGPCASHRRADVVHTFVKMTLRYLSLLPSLCPLVLAVPPSSWTASALSLPFNLTVVTMHRLLALASPTPSAFASPALLPGLPPRAATTTRSRLGATPRRPAVGALLARRQRQPAGGWLAASAGGASAEPPSPAPALAVTAATALSTSDGGVDTAAAAVAVPVSDGSAVASGGDGGGDVMAEARAALAAAGVVAAAGAAFPLVLAATEAGAGGPSVAALLATKYASHYTMLAGLAAFALLHSGLAALRSRVTPITGERAYRVGFALSSIAGAVATIGYFIAHRYDGAVLWRLQGVPGVHEAVWVASALSFLLLYPATFNLAEVAAVARPGFRIYETGVMRITRHPQLWGQVLWCVAHGAWLGSSMVVVASAGLIAHHLFGAWHGDTRLRHRYGDEWDAYARRTSLVPFVALADGRQRVGAADWAREWAGWAYVGVVAFVWAAYASHPAVLRLVGQLRW
ncbi:hypothetical protein I4F81_005606 [Pyropia yezoensis]|uniref:Uncharacterized protein n=1 Tax=Pyropia yezoensis TaxID=2788 RepID=A0ACC3BYC4_PYRYE|nr:hypothetical protein I4F81_005606 [Neopyropia yezoensis]